MMRDQLFDTSRIRDHRTAKPWMVSAVAHGLLVFVLVFRPSPDRIPQPAPADREPSSQIVWLSEPGPGGGGGGGGDRSSQPPQHAQLRGQDALTVPVAPAPSPQVDKEIKPEAFQNLEIPAETLASANLETIGVLESEPPGISRGPGAGPGAGSGTQGGIGSGDGNGLGVGQDRGTGGDVYQPGSGVTSPRALYRAQPRYTSAAMKARIQGAVVVECVVDTKGICSRLRLIRSLDSTFGLDEQALRAAAEWKFVPGTRLGEPVPVLVRIELGFAIH